MEKDEAVEKVVNEFRYGRLSWIEDDEVLDAIETLVDYIEDQWVLQGASREPGCTCPSFWWGRGIDWRCQVHKPRFSTTTNLDK